MKKLFVLFIAFLVSALSACNEEAISVSSENAQHEESSVAVNESSTVSEESRELTLEEKNCVSHRAKAFRKFAESFVKTWETYYAEQ